MGSRKEISVPGTIYRLLAIGLAAFSFLATNNAHAQSRSASAGWTIQAIDGSYSLIGQRRDLSNTFRTGKNSRNELFSLYAELNATIKSYIRHPDIVKLDIDVGLNPGVRNESILRTPARNQAQTAEKIGIRTSFFRTSPVSVHATAAFDHRYVFRDYVNSVEARRFSTSGVVSLNSTIVKANFSHRWSDWAQKELQSDRMFRDTQQVFAADFRKDTRFYGAHRINLKYEDVSREQRSVYKIGQTVRDMRIYNRMDWKTPGKNFWRSEIRLNSLRGTAYLDRTQILESVRFDLPWMFSMSGTYDFSRVSSDEASRSVNKASGTVSHQLFASLRSEVVVEYSNSNESSLNETWRAYGFTLEYQKRLPVGRLSVTWSKRFRDQEQENKAGNLIVVDEGHKIDDDIILLLNHSNVDARTIVVSNADRTILYEEGIDFLILDAGPYIELRRLLGGQILEGATIRVDYVAGPVEFSFDEQEHGFFVNFSTLKNIVRVYYRLRDLSYNNVQKSAENILKTVDQSIIGGQISYRNVSAGVEKDIFKSNITPYRTERIYGSLWHTFGSRITTSVSGSRRAMLLTDTRELRTYSNLIASVQYRLGATGRIYLDGGYQIDRGPGVDLDLKRLGIEFGFDRRSSSFTVGVTFFTRTFLSDELTYTDLRLRYKKTF